MNLTNREKLKPNDEALFVPTRVAVLRPFYNERKLLEEGAETSISWYLAQEMAAIGKVKIL